MEFKDEAAYKKYLSEQGIDTVQEDATEAKPVETKPEVDDSEEDDTDDTKSQEDSESEEPKQKEAPKKESIYKAHKEKKRALREEIAKSTDLEKKLAEKDAKIEELQKLADAATTQKEKQEVKDEIEQLASEYNLDPSFLKKLSSTLLNEVKPSITKSVDPESASKIQKIVETQEFNEEFEETLPFIEETFGKLNDSDLKNVQSELNRLAHTKEFHDKDLDYIVFKNRGQLNSVITPKKRGIETKTRNEEKEAEEESSFDFSQTPDFDNMSDAQVKAWEVEYNKLKGKKTGLTTGPNGKKFFI